ncbi:hypothetical protein BR93DRAFT_200289 [Coniochaeta sp. PMI_546]|nr:hypothetical protein BR93DRAFT_200289 [Coniochaeta sp. PMI_546]
MLSVWSVLSLPTYSRTAEYTKTKTIIHLSSCSLIYLLRSRQYFLANNNFSSSTNARLCDDMNSDLCTVIFLERPLHILNGSKLCNWRIWSESRGWLASHSMVIDGLFVCRGSLLTNS